MEQLLSLLELERAAGSGQADAALIRRVARREVEHLGIVEPPVDVEMLASAHGVLEVVDDPSLSVAGCLITDTAGRLTVRVRSSDPLARQRFTIAHEVARTFCPGYARATQYRCSPQTMPDRDSDLENLCDIAASELLMPEPLWAVDVGAASFDLDSIEDLAERYGVSLVAGGYRFIDQWQDSAALLVFEVGQKPSEVGTDAPDRLRLRYWHRVGRWLFFLRHKSLAVGDCFHRALEGEIVHEKTIMQGISREPVAVEVSARLYPYRAGHQLRRRVIALARQLAG